MPLKKEQGHATGLNRSNLAAKSDFTALQAKVNKLHINDLIKVPNGLNDLEKKVDHLNVGRFEKIN